MNPYKLIQNQMDYLYEESKKAAEKNTRKECRYCHGTGVYYEPNGHDDFNTEICRCQE